MFKQNWNTFNGVAIIEKVVFKQPNANKFFVSVWCLFEQIGFANVQHTRPKSTLYFCESVTMTKQRDFKKKSGKRNRI